MVLDSDLPEGNGSKVLLFIPLEGSESAAPGPFQMSWTEALVPGSTEAGGQGGWEVIRGSFVWEHGYVERTKAHTGAGHGLCSPGSGRGASALPWS